jgi:hypothetical protein
MLHLRIHDSPLAADRSAYERALLRYTLIIRTREGFPVVWAATPLLKFVDDLDARMMFYQGVPTEIAARAMGAGEAMGSEPQCLSGCITQS